MNHDDVVGQVMLILGIVMCFAAAIFTNSFNRSGKGGRVADSHPTRWRVVPIILGPAASMPWYSQYEAPR
jgi:hypothetical protein